MFNPQAKDCEIKTPSTGTSKNKFISGSNFLSININSIGSKNIVFLAFLGFHQPQIVKFQEKRLRDLYFLEKLDDPSAMIACQASIDGRLVSLATLVDEDAELDSIVTQFNKVVTDKATERLGKQRQNKKPWVTDNILDCCDQNKARGV